MTNTDTDMPSLTVTPEITAAIKYADHLYETEQFQAYEVIINLLLTISNSESAHKEAIEQAKRETAEKCAEIFFNNCDCTDYDNEQWAVAMARAIKSAAD